MRDEVGWAGAKSRSSSKDINLQTSGLKSDESKASHQFTELANKKQKKEFGLGGN